MTPGLVIAAPRSGSGKTLVTLGLVAALRARGLDVAPAKVGPDYIDTAFLTRVAGRQAINLDPWAMRAGRLAVLAAAAAEAADLLLVEGVMGLFDGAADGRGSTADLAETLDLPIVLVVDAERQGQSIAPLVSGFAGWRPGVRVAGVIVNRVGSMRHERLLRDAMRATGLPVLGVLPRREALSIPERQLGLILPAEIAAFDALSAAAAEAMSDYLDLAALLAIAAPLGGMPVAADAALVSPGVAPLPPLGQHIAIARDEAFAFLYAHWLADWRRQGAAISFFSPLADEAPPLDADAVFLPGGYPELHGARLAAATSFKAGLAQSAARGALVYGECGGFMVLGDSLADKAGVEHPMAGLLPVSTRIDRPKRTLGYRRLFHASPLPWPAALNGHEFHYSSARRSRLPQLFAATDALGETLPSMGAQLGNVMGSYAHVIDVA